MASYDLSKRAHAADHAPGGAADLSEIIQDVVAAFVVAGANVTKTYDDAAGTLTITATPAGGGTDVELVRDTIGAALRGGTNISVTVNDAADTITLAVTGLASVATSGSATDLTGTLDPARIADGTLSAAKLDFAANGAFTRSVFNGSSTTTPRPAGSGMVIWVGSVASVNMADGDIRISTS